MLHFPGWTKPNRSEQKARERERKEIQAVSVLRNIRHVNSDLRKKKKLLLIGKGKSFPATGLSRPLEIQEVKAPRFCRLLALLIGNTTYNIILLWLIVSIINMKCILFYACNIKTSRVNNLNLYRHY